MRERSRDKNRLEHMLRRSKILEERRKHVDPEIRRSVDLSFQIVDRIHDILVSDTLVSIEDALQAPILNVVHQDLEICV